MYDLIIIGAGAGGLTAALFAARYKLNALVLSKDIGGLSLEASEIENYPGFISVSGAELMKQFSKQVDALGVEIRQEEVTRIEKKNNFVLKTDKKSYDAKSIILAIGTKRRTLNIEGEERFLGKGISYCANCDAPLFKNKIVAVVGGSDAAAMSALLLAEYAKKVYIVYRKSELRADPITVEKIKKSKKIEAIYNANVANISGKDFLESVSLDNEKALEIDGLFIEIGATPSLALTKPLGLNTDSLGYIAANERMETNVEGVFAVGDIVKKDLRQIITACADGAIAALYAYKYIKQIKK